MAKKKAAAQTEVDEDDVEQTEEEERTAALASFYKTANKLYGKNTIQNSNDYKFKERKFISTGIVPLDYALGGGIPVGRISMFYGHKSTAKTTNILRLVGNAQRQCSKCWGELTYPEAEGKELGAATCPCGKARKTVVAWLDVEGVWEDEWASNFVNIDDTLLLSQPKNAEETIDLAYAALKSMVDIIVIDSIAFMTPIAEQERSAAEQTVGTQARLMGNAMRRFVAAMNELGREKGYRPTVIMTNQIRQKVGVMYGNPETLSGGLAAGFATSVEIKTNVGKYEMDTVTGKPIMAQFKAKVEKNKISAPKMEAEWHVQLLRTELKKVGDIIDEEWTLSMAEKAGLVSVAPQRVEWNGHTFRGQSLLVKYWMEHRNEYLKFKNELMPLLLAA